MKSVIVLAVLSACAVAALPVIAHHAAEGIVDEEIYAMIDDLVANTPHADLVFEDMGGGMTRIGIETTLPELEELVAAGLLRYAAMLDGEVSLTITFTDDRLLTAVILQDEGAAAADKALPADRDASFGEVKAEYR